MVVVGFKKHVFVGLPGSVDVDDVSSSLGFS